LSFSVIVLMLRMPSQPMAPAISATNRKPEISFVPIFRLRYHCMMFSLLGMMGGEECFIGC
jgi:hypothetical protein